MVEHILQHLEMYFPYVYETMESYEYDNAFGITVTTFNGQKIYYDDANNSIRYLPTDKDSLTEEEYRTEFGYQVRNMMVQKGINQAALSEITGIGQAQLSRYITGKNTPSNYIARKIARALECSIDELSYM